MELFKVLTYFNYTNSKLNICWVKLECLHLWMLMYFNSKAPGFIKIDMTRGFFIPFLLMGAIILMTMITVWMVIYVLLAVLLGFVQTVISYAFPNWSKRHFCDFSPEYPSSDRPPRMKYIRCKRIERIDWADLSQPYYE